MSPLVYKDRVRETTTTTGTGTVTLAGAVAGFRTFTSALATGSVVTYCIEDGTNWEVGQGTFTTAGLTLSRTTVIASSTGSAISFGAGSKNVFLTKSARDSFKVASIEARTANYTAVPGDLVRADATGGSFTVTLPTAVGIEGLPITVKRMNSGNNLVTIATTSSQTIDGDANGHTLGSQYESLTFVSDGANWIII